MARAVGKETGGFKDLVDFGRLDLAMEWVVLDPRWKFPADVRAIAHGQRRVHERKRGRAHHAQCS